MQIKTMRKDRSGMSTIFAVIAVVIIVVIAAAAAYVLLSNDNDEEKTLAPGSYYHYDIIENDETYHSEDTIIGQNSTEYFFEAKETRGGTTVTFYYTSPKLMPEDAVKTGDVEIETIDGLKTVEIWEFQEEYYGTMYDVKVHYDPSLDMWYITEYSNDSGFMETQTIVEYKEEWQTSYKESENLHKTYGYLATVDWEVSTISIECVADCLDGKYGIMFLASDGSEICFLSDYPEGLPDDAVDTGNTITLTDTIDGDVVVGVWEMTTYSGQAWMLYVEPDTHVIYQFSLVYGGETYTFVLDSKPA